MRPRTGIYCKANERDFNYLQSQVSHSVYSMHVHSIESALFQISPTDVAPSVLVLLMWIQQ